MNSETGTESRHLAQRLLLLVVAIVVVALLAYSEEIHQQVVRVIGLAEPVIRSTPVLGAVIFVALSALSAMLVFFSGVLLVPLGIGAWGPLVCFLLLWGGWFLGGVITYSIGRVFGRPVVLRLVSEDKLARYENRIPQGSSFVTALLTQLVLPSDISGYFFGLLGYPARVYLGSLALAELPYALGTVYLGTAFVEQQYLLLLVAAAVGLVILGLVWLRQR
jgi:uncharacterized membrane protein YdjX (TVP38/TMEM64 family)